MEVEQDFVGVGSLSVENVARKSMNLKIVEQRKETTSVHTAMEIIVLEAKTV